MPTLGQQLRQERQKQNRTLAEIASSTCISSRYLQAIEEDDYKVLPGGMFNRSFVKQYCTALGLDPASLERDINTALPLDEPDPLPVLSETYQTPISIGSGRGITTTWLVVLFVAAIAGSSGFYAWWQRIQHPAEAPVQASSNPPPAVVEQPPVQVQPEPQLQAQAQPPPPPADSTKVNLQLQATERTWISLSAGGKTLFAGILDASERKDLDGLENAKLITGNAAGLDVRWNGKPLGPLGPRGQVRTILFTPEKYEVVQPAPKKSVSPDAPEQRAPTGVG